MNKKLLGHMLVAAFALSWCDGPAPAPRPEPEPPQAPRTACDPAPAPTPAPEPPQAP